VVERHVVADLGGLTNDDTHPVVDEETTPDPCTRVNLHPGQPTPEIRRHARQPFPLMRPQPMGKSMDPDGVQPRITGQHLERVAGCRIAMEYALDVFAHAFEHQSLLRL